MDGNGRWAAARGKARSHGHRAGARTVRRIVEAAPELGIGILTLYAFSSDNWTRPPDEVRSLMRLFKAYLRSQAEDCARQGARLEVIGRRDRLAPPLIREIEAAEARTGGSDRLLLRVALDYSARHAILAAAALRPDGPIGRRAFADLLARGMHSAGPAPDVDLVIRTGGERRLSDFLLWESAYAELLFTERLWPDFTSADLEEAVQEYRKRERRFGGVPAATPEANPVRTRRTRHQTAHACQYF
jgi:undecaprenyl diphosphate synthase